jgi:hypothetical protein
MTLALVRLRGELALAVIRPGVNGLLECVNTLTV